MRFTQQVRIEFIHVKQLFTTNIAPPRIRLAMATFMKKVQRLIREQNATEEALKGRGEVFLEV